MSIYRFEYLFKGAVEYSQWQDCDGIRVHKL